MNQYFAVFEQPSVVWVSNSMIQTRIDSQYYKTNYVENEYKIEKLGYEKLSNIIERGDYGILPDTEDYGNIGVPLIRGTDLRNLSIEIKEMIRVPKTYLSEKSQLQYKDILLLIKGATIDDEWSVSIVPKINEEMIFNGSIFRIRLKSNYDPYFITAFMSTNYFLLQKTRAISNTGIYYNDKDSIGNFLIPIPSPEIQEYIGNKVRRAEELREEAKKLREEAEDIVNSAIDLKKLVSKVNEFTMKSKWVNSINISERVDSQFHINPIIGVNKYMANTNMNLVRLRKISKVGKGFSYSSDKCNGEVPYIRISDLEDLLIDYSEVVKVYHKVYQEKKKSQLKEYDLVMAITGATIGKISIFYSKEVDRATLSADTAYVRFNNLEDSVIYLIYFKTVIGQLAITQGITGATNKHLAIEDIKNIVLPEFEQTIKQAVKSKIIRCIEDIYYSKELIQEAKQDVEDLIEGNFDMSKLSDTTPESR